MPPPNQPKNVGSPRGDTNTPPRSAMDEAPPVPPGSAGPLFEHNMGAPNTPTGYDPTKTQAEQGGKNASAPAEDPFATQQAPTPDLTGFDAADRSARQADIDRQTATNRPNQYGPNGSITWGADGSQTTTLSPELQAALGSKVDYGALPSAQSGSDARNQAIAAALDASEARLNPQWNRREASMRARLAAQGISDTSSEAGRGALSQLDAARNDAYAGARNAAILQGNDAGNSIFRNSMQTREQALAEALQAHKQPFEDANAANRAVAPPSFAMAGSAGGSSSMSAALAKYGIDAAKLKAAQEGDAEAVKTVMSALGMIALASGG